MKDFKQHVEWDKLSHEEKQEAVYYMKMEEMREEHIYEGQLEERQEGE